MIYRIPEVDSNIFYGRFGGLSVLRAVARSLLAVSQSPQTTSTSPGHELVQAFHDLTLVPRRGSFDLSLRPPTFLPSKVQVLNHVSYASRTALICHDCLDHARWPKQLDRLYDMDVEDYSADDEHFLALVYALIGLSMRYTPPADSDAFDDPTRIRLKGYAPHRKPSPSSNDLSNRKLASDTFMPAAKWYRLPSHPVSIP